MEQKALQSYWDGTGKFQDLYTKLNALIPEIGRCEHSRSKNKKLEKLRTSANAYYDIFNNGGCNRGAEIRYHFGISVAQYSSGHNGRRHVNWTAISKKIDPIMDGIVLQAAIEQKLIDADCVDAIVALTN